MNKTIFTIILLLLNNPVFTAEEPYTEEAIQPVLVSILIDLPSQCTVTNISGSAKLSVRNTGGGYREIQRGDKIDQRMIVFMSKMSAISLSGKNNQVITLQTEDKAEIFTFQILP